MRALEGAAAKEGGLRAGPGETDLVITPAFRPRVVDGILSGAHAAHESHFSLLAAFAGPDLLAAAADHAERAGFLTHELGDSMLVLPGALAAAQPRPSATRNRALTLALCLPIPRLSDLQFASGPHRLARPRTMPFQGMNAGSNPAGVAVPERFCRSAPIADRPSHDARRATTPIPVPTSPPSHRCKPRGVRS